YNEYSNDTKNDVLKGEERERARREGRSYARFRRRGFGRMSERIRARYLIETADDPRRAVEVMAGEQSSGTFVAVPGETPELKERAGARVESLTEIETVATPSLPGARAGAAYRRCEVE